MGLTARNVELYRQDARSNHTWLTPEKRRSMVEPYLPPLPSQEALAATRKRTKGHRTQSRLGVRRFARNQLHLIIYTVIHALFSVYVRIRQAWQAVKDRVFTILYHHHHTPELIQKDIRELSRLPQHLSVILKLEGAGKGGAALEALVDEAAEVTAWSACAGIQVLSIYESTGILKAYVPQVHRAIERKLAAYFGPQRPALSLRAPHIPAMESSSDVTADESVGAKNISVLLISAEDGRDSIVDLTKTLAEMSQRSKLSASDIGQDLVDAELTESIMGEPDLLILFGPSIELCGYPPWQLRLTEIYHIHDNHGVGYQVFLRALYNFANAKFNFGR